MGGKVLFVCPHGAGKSRIAAAWFDGSAPAGWSATTAGLQPQRTVSAHAPRLLADSPVEHLLDLDLPRPLSAVGGVSLVVAIDCPSGAIPGALPWHLDHTELDQAMNAQLRELAQSLAGSLAGHP